jgi:hypothetical protein
VHTVVKTGAKKNKYSKMVGILAIEAGNAVLRVQLQCVRMPFAVSLPPNRTEPVF